MLWVAVPLDFDSELLKELRTSRQVNSLDTYIFCSLSNLQSD
jgi:hypothetical protein